MTVKLSLAKQIEIVSQIVDDAKERNDERIVLEACKVLERLQNTEHKMIHRNRDYIHKSQVMVIGQVVISILARHLQDLPNYGETIESIGNEIGDRLAVEMDGQ